MLSRLVIAFLPRSKRPLVSWLQSPSAVILSEALIQEKMSLTPDLTEKVHFILERTHKCDLSDA